MSSRLILVLSLLLSQVSASYAQLDCVVAFSHQNESSAHYAELAAVHPLLAKSRAIKLLPWKAAEQGVFTTEAVSFGQGSHWIVSVQPSGKMYLYFRLSKKDGYGDAVDEIFNAAEDVVDAAGEDVIQGREDVYTTLFIKNLTDADLKPSNTASAGGRGIFIDKIAEHFYGSFKPELADVAGKEFIPAVVKGNARLGSALAKSLAVAAAKEGSNFYFSPYSMSIAWTMALLGASDSIQPEMLSLFGNTVTAEELKQGVSALKKAIFTPGQETLVSANSIWVNHQIKLKTSYQEEMKALYGAEIQARDFSDGGVKDEINTWVEKNTLGLVKDLLDRTDSSALTYLINAMGAKVKWKSPFDPELTYQRNFNLGNGKTKPVQMMNKSAKFSYVENGQVSGVSLATIEGEVTFDFFLPNEVLTAEQIGASIDLAQIHEWSQAFQPGQQGSVSMPKLKLGYKAELIDAVRAQGVQAPFLTGPNFDRMLEGNAQISSIIQQTFLELDEFGAKTGVATSISVSRSAAPMGFHLSLTRPYILSVRHQASGEILFVGVISNP